MGPHRTDERQVVPQECSRVLEDTTCECGDKSTEQTVEHVLLRCAITREASNAARERAKINTLLYTNKGIQATLARWAHVEKRSKEAKRADRKFEARQDSELKCEKRPGERMRRTGNVHEKSELCPQPFP